MTGWVRTFLAVALITFAFGFGGLATAAAGIARALFYLSMALLVVSVVAILLVRRRPPRRRAPRDRRR